MRRVVVSKSSSLSTKEDATNNGSTTNSTRKHPSRPASGRASNGSRFKLVSITVLVLVFFWISITLYILSSTTSNDGDQHRDVISSLFHPRQRNEMLRSRETREKNSEDSNHGLLEKWKKAREQPEKQEKKKTPPRHDHRVKRRGAGHRLRPRENKEHNNVELRKKFGVQNDLVTLWNRKRMFQQRLGGYQRPTVRVPSNLQHAKTSLDKILFHGFNTTAKELDMRDLNYELPFDNPDGGAWKQGWDVKNTHKRPLTIYVLPHSHCDPGWIKTFDEYFQAQTKRIITTVVDALRQDKRRKFVWAEISYFEWWWREQSAEVQDATRKLLKNGQLEFVTGGWVQPDEANTQLYAMEIQLQEGHDWINATFGEEYIPKYGWSIDPFGYSPTMAYLLKKYDFKAMLIQRVHYAIKKELASRQHLEFYWRQTWESSGDGRRPHDIFTHVMPFFSYDVPHTCGPDPSVCCQFDFARQPMRGATAPGCPWRIPPREITNDNVKERALLLLDQYEKKAALYRSNVVLIPLGDDFRYRTEDEAENQYSNYQKMFDYINDNVDGVSIQFGTLSEYFTKARKTYKGQVPTLKGSFFTYADVNEDYWSGYFTSRIFDKALDRKLERVLYAASKMGASRSEMQEPRRALSLFQHHDGVTGTAKDHVVKDYAQRIHNAINFVQDHMIQYVQKQYKEAEADSIAACWKSDAPRGLSQNLCLPAAKEKQEALKVYLYNPLNTSQACGDVVVDGHKTAVATLPCEKAGPLPGSKAGITFDARTGLMRHPISENWMVWNVQEGGAYLFHPGTLSEYDAEEVDISSGGYVVSTPSWKRRVIERKVPSDLIYKDGSSKATTTVIDFVFETNLQTSNEEWFVRFGGEVQNDGVFHTDLNGFNFDTHRFRDDMPIQSQVFPMPTLASIQDEDLRMTVLSEHAQGTASLQDGTIDVWLDRRLDQDDARGLGQGVKDNVPTRTRLRVILENDGYDNLNGAQDFQPTPVCRRMWDELNHPLEMFGTHQYTSAQVAKESAEKTGLVEEEDVDQEGQFDLLPGESLYGAQKDMVLNQDDQKTHTKDATERKKGKQSDVIPFVIMVYKRVDYLEKAIESIRISDFDKKKTPLIISMDGHVEKMMDFVETLKSEFQLTVLTHPYSCHDHPDTFPGQDESLNAKYKGDSYGNKRSAWATCAKHHFTWMLNAVFSLDTMSHFDTFLFLEEDYIVAPTIYETLQNGVFLLQKLSDNHHDVFGICLDPTEGHTKKLPYRAREGWFTNVFKSGPMTVSRQMYKRVRKYAKEFCTFDDYNWDWTIVHLMGREKLPALVILPSVPQALHIGAKDGMHGETARGTDKSLMARTTAVKPFHGTKLYKVPTFYSKPRTHESGFGGWGHPADQDHCIQVMTGAKT